MHGHGIVSTGMLNQPSQLGLERTVASQQAAGVRRSLRQAALEMESELGTDSDDGLMVTAWNGSSGEKGGGERRNGPQRDRKRAVEDEGPEAVSFWA